MPVNFFHFFSSFIKQLYFYINIQHLLQSIGVKICSPAPIMLHINKILFCFLITYFTKHKSTTNLVVLLVICYFFSAYYATMMLTSLPGITITLRTCLPSIAAFTFSSARAIASISLLSMPFAITILLRIFAFT